MFASIAALALATGANSTMPSSDPCMAFESNAQPSGVESQVPTALDLAKLADIGRADPHDSASPFGISPDGLWIAFVVRRANPMVNAFCQRLMIAPLNGRGVARELDRGGELIRNLFGLRNLPAVRAGTAQVITPRWSPDGRTIAYLKRTDSRTRIWTVKVDGKPAVPAVDLPFEIEDFTWASDGRGFIVSGRPELARADAAIDVEARQGYLFDDRFSPMMSDRPFPTGSFPTRFFHVALAGNIVRVARPAEEMLIDPQADSRRPVGAGEFAVDGDGGTAWTEKRNPLELLSPVQLRVAWSTGRRSSCLSDPCARIRHIWWGRSRDALYFVTREGWANSQTSLYRWRIEDAQPVRVLTTDDSLVGCEPVPTELICAREGSRTPRRLVAINIDNGRMRTIFDPNPEFGRLKLGPVRRLRFRNAYGVECFADLVLPPGSKLGAKLPLVVVQYYSEGFLRGGVGDEVPIQVLAGRGFAVLSIERPFDPPGTEGATSELDYRRLVRKDWIDRKSVQSAIETAIKAAVDTGMVDGRRLGISGFSEGSSATQWALINSRLFKVASLGSCCEDKIALPMNGGIGYEHYLEEMGYSLFENADDCFWAPLSLVQNVDKIDVPILIQTSDDEYEGGLDVMGAYRRRGKPIEMFIFKNEPHVKWQPAHRLAMYDRVIDWFAFWLQGIVDCSPAKQSQYDRWREMRGAPQGLAQCAGSSALDLSRAHASASTMSNSR
ncbi:Atxe2 family lasso peptide isopeptidase [uncultured Sphingomonas sp.]|uniref:Atxe2 family lasso peptide isopeptidase n=1 Tax=uncultured Sphingomonas sp. TaxID=158754 RepID=UPI002621E29C|nr:Atxe2 family lasso peptide isopeptidase [uncultured Sphingomonas sp.]